MRKAFTLVELLVVIGVIAILMGILLPVLSKVRGQSDRVACRAQLRDLGAAFVMYFSDSKGRLPAVNTMPSVKPPLNDAPSIVKVLQPYIRTATKVFRCPSDRITKVSANAAAGFETYFEREGSSYQYNTFLVKYAGQRTQDTLAYSLGQKNLLTILGEYEPFHGKAGTVGSMNYLFGDMRVGSLGE